MNRTALKPTMLKLAAAMLLAISPAVQAVTPIEREFLTLSAQRDKEVQDAAAPVNKKYRAQFEQLLRKATQAGELEAAIKITRELGVAKSENAELLVAKICASPWTWTRGKRSEKMTFNRDGTVKHAAFAGTWTARASREVVITLKDKEAKLKFNDALNSYEGTDFDGKTVISGEMVQ